MIADLPEALFWVISMDVRSIEPSRLGQCCYLVRPYKFSRLSHIHMRFVAPHTFLMSRKNSMMTVYDVSRSGDGLIRSNIPPYSLPPISGNYIRSTGHVIFQHPSESNDIGTAMYQLTERGSIHCRYFDFPPGGQVNADREIYEWSTDVQSLARKANIGRDVGLLGSRSSSEVNLRHAYQSKWVSRYLPPPDIKV